MTLPVADTSPVAADVEPGAEGRERVHVLRDGGRILVRPLRNSDREELAARYEELSPESRRLRFFNAPEHLDGQLLDYLLNVDGEERFALGAQAIDEPGQPGIAVARYVRSHDDRSVAEAAVTVLDSHRDRGIATLLLDDLVEEAVARGITVFTASVMWENEMLLDALRARGAVVVPEEPGLAAVSVRLVNEPEDDGGVP